MFSSIEVIVSNSSCNFSGEQIDRALWVRIEIKLSFLFLRAKRIPTNVLACESGFSVDRDDKFWRGFFNHNNKKREGLVTFFFEGELQGRVK